MNDRSDALCARVARRAIWLALCALIPAEFAVAQASGGNYTLRKHVIGAGVLAQGAPYRLSATAGQPSAGVASGGSYVLTAGFHAPGHAAGTDRIFCNGFDAAACNPPSGVPE